MSVHNIQIHCSFALPVLEGETVVSFLQSNNTHHSVYQRLILVYDPTKPMEERHGSSTLNNSCKPIPGEQINERTQFV